MLRWPAVAAATIADWLARGLQQQCGCPGISKRSNDPFSTLRKQADYETQLYGTIVLTRSSTVTGHGLHPVPIT